VLSIRRGGADGVTRGAGAAGGVGAVAVAGGGASIRRDGDGIARPGVSGVGAADGVT